LGKDLLPKAIRRLGSDDPQTILLRETIHLHPDVVPLAREIFRILVRHRRHVPTRAVASLPRADERDSR
jgi:hypothetical protein